MRDGDRPGNVEVMTLRCLIVDDSPAFVAAARTLLERHGITVLAAASTSADALRLTTELQPDVLLVDIDLGPDSGLDLARRLTHRTGPTPPPPVILISSHAEEDYTDLIADTPALGFIAKTDLTATAIHKLLDHPR
jgi:CheY-like chemotaxis protein